MSNFSKENHNNKHNTSANNKTTIINFVLIKPKYPIQMILSTTFIKSLLNPRTLTDEIVSPNAQHYKCT